MDDVDLYVDGALIGRISKGKPLTLPSLPSGLHEFQGVRDGYEPDRKEVMIAPGQEVTVSLRIRYVRQVKKPAQALNERGREAAVHAPLVDEPDEPAADRAHARAKPT